MKFLWPVLVQSRWKIRRGKIKNLTRVSFLVVVTWRIIISLAPFYILVNGVYQSYSSTKSLMLEHQFLDHEREIILVCYAKKVWYSKILNVKGTTTDPLCSLRNDCMQPLY